MSLKDWAILGVVLGALGFCFLLHHMGYVDGVRDTRTSYERAEKKAKEEATKAATQAENQRAADLVANQKLEQDLTDAVAKAPNSVPSAHRIALGCAQLRRSGQDISKLPQCSGLNR